MAGHGTSVHDDVYVLVVMLNVKTPPVYPLPHEQFGAPIPPVGHATTLQTGEPVHAPSEHMYDPDST